MFKIIVNNKVVFRTDSYNDYIKVVGIYYTKKVHVKVKSDKVSIEFKIAA